MLSSHPKVFAIILNYNGKHTLKECLKSIYKSNYPNLEIVVVDNDSKDGSFEAAKKSFPKAHYIKNEKNIGFGAGNNIGIRFALEKMTDYIFLLNNDAEVNSETISSLVRGAEGNSIKILSPVIKLPSGSIWFGGGKIDWLRMKTIHEPPRQYIITPYETEYVTGCAVLIHKNAYKEVGLFDEKFFLYYEDTDWCVRARKKGYIPFVCPQTFIMHKEQSEEFEEKVYWLVLSGLLFFHEHTPFKYKIWNKIYRFTRKIYAKKIHRKQPSKKTELVLKAFVDFKNTSL